MYRKPTISGINDSSSSISNLIDFLYKMVEWLAIVANHLIKIISVTQYELLLTNDLKLLMLVPGYSDDSLTIVIVSIIIVIAKI